MEDLLDKLKLLNYEKELVLKMRMRPINRQAANRLLLSRFLIQTLLHDPDKFWGTVLPVHLPVSLAYQDSWSKVRSAPGLRIQSIQLNNNQEFSFAPGV